MKNILITTIVLIFLSSCSILPTPKWPMPVTTDTGVVVQVTDFMVTIEYDVVIDAPSNKCLNTVYFQHGHSYKVGDTYPYYQNHGKVTASNE